MRLALFYRSGNEESQMGEMTCPKSHSRSEAQRTAVQLWNVQHSTRLMLRPGDLILVNGHLNLPAKAAQARGKAHKTAGTSASDGGYGKDSFEMQREKASAFRKSMGMSLEETLVTKRLYHKVKSKEVRSGGTH